MKKILILVSDHNREIVEVGLETIHKIINAHKMDSDTIRISGFIELSCALNSLLENFEYSGVIILGALLRDELIFDAQSVYNRSIDGVLEVISHYGIPIGVSLTLNTNTKEALSIINESAKKAVETCMQIMIIKDDVSEMSYYQVYEN
jgi:6,7-dimethyl-8-ribityllumazine synthase